MNSRRDRTAETRSKHAGCVQRGLLLSTASSWITAAIALPHVTESCGSEPATCGLEHGQIGLWKQQPVHRAFVCIQDERSVHAEPAGRVGAERPARPALRGVACTRTPNRRPSRLRRLCSSTSLRHTTWHSLTAAAETTTCIRCQRARPAKRSKRQPPYRLPTIQRLGNGRQLWHQAPFPAPRCNTAGLLHLRCPPA